MNSPVAKIKERLSIEEVVSSYIKLERAGKNLKAKCPFHNEKTPSFFVSPSRGSYYCFGCGAGGDIFSFVEEFEGLDFRGALKLLADKAGVPLEHFNPEEEGKKEKLYRIMEEATRYFENNLLKNPEEKQSSHGAGKEVLEYLNGRGLTEKSIKDFRIGFARNEWRGLHEELKSKFSDKELEEAGLIKTPSAQESTSPLPRGREGGGVPYDRFRDRIMFPIADSSGRIIAFSGRIFVDDGKSAKYLNSPETPIFSKSAVFYGLDKAKDSIRKNNFSILVEGQMDLILSHQAGYKNTIATSGTALSDATVSKENIVSNLGLVRRLTPNIVLAFDGDTAGANASNRAGRIALSLGMDVKVANIPEGVDPADLISKSGTDTWREAIKNSKHIIEFLLNKTLQNSGNDARKVGKEIKEKVLPYVDMLESAIDKAHFIKKISTESNIPENALKDDLQKIEQELKYEKREIEETEESLGGIYRKDYILRKLLGIILWQKTLKQKTLDVDGMLKRLADILKITENLVLEGSKGSEEDFIFEAEIFYGGDADLRADTEEMISNLEEECLKEKLAGKMRELYLAEEAKDLEKSNQILKECQIVNNKIQDIKNGRIKNKNI